jgi:hypothetical protein
VELTARAPKRQQYINRNQAKPRLIADEKNPSLFRRENLTGIEAAR